METTKSNTQNTEKTTFDTLTYTMKGKIVILPQFIGSSNKKFNDVILADMELDASLEDTLGGYEYLFEGDDYYEELFNDDIFSDEMHGVFELMKSYSKLMDEGNEDAGVNLMTMLFRIYQKTGNLKKRYYSTLNKLIATKNYAAEFFLALDWMLHSDKSWMDDYIVERGYSLMSELAQNGDWFAEMFYEYREQEEEFEQMLKEYAI